MTRDESTAERIAKYEAWVLRLEGAYDDYERRLPRYRVGFGLLVAGGFACFLRSVPTGIWASLCAIFVSIGGHFMLRTRLWELETEILDTRRAVERLRREHAANEAEAQP